MLLDTCGRHLDALLPLLIAIDDDNEILGDDIGVGGTHANLDPDYLVWSDLKVVWLDRDARFAADLLADGDMTCQAALILELDELALLLAHRDKLEVDDWLELNVRGRHEGVQVQLVWLGIALSQYFNHIVEISRLSGLELHAHLDAETGGNTANVLILAVEARVLRLREHDATHVLGDVPDSHSHFIVLIWLNIYFQKDIKLLNFKFS